MKHKLVLTIMVFCVLDSDVSVANPIWSTADCDSSGTYNNMVDTNQTILNYYVESDFAAEMEACTPTDDSDMTEFHLQQTVKDAAEVWNAESRAVYLRYAGTFSGTPESTCSSAIPAIYIQYQPGCRVPTGSTLCSSEFAFSEHLPGCDSSSKITFFGDENTFQCINTGIRDYQLTHPGVPGDLWLRGILVHELGHVLGLDHPNKNSVPNVAHGDTVMWSPATNMVEDFTHLWPWDKDCVDERWDGRVAKVRSKSYSSTGVAVEDEFVTSTYTEKGSISGYPWRYDGNHYYAYSILDPSGDYRRASVGSDGYLSWTDSGTDWTSSLVDTSPLFTNVYPVSGGYQMVYYLWNSSATQDPPNVKGLYSTNFFSTRSYGNLTSTASYTPVLSHIPPSSAYDPISGETIFVVVNTDRASADEGGIRVYPGMRSATRNLEAASGYVHDEVSAPSSAGYINWDYSLQTHFGVGVACADVTVGGYNCVLAWIDRGTPDNRILYTWFKVVGTTVYWDTDSYVRSNGFAINHISLAFINDEIKMAFKRTGSGVDIGLTSNDLTSQTGWDTVVNHFPNGWVVDPPTWAGMGSSNEYTLMWSETP